MNNRILAILVALGLVLSFAVNASAAESVTMPDLTQKGSLTLTMDVDGEPLDSGNLNLYYVATLVQEGATQYDFRLLPALTAAGGTLDTEDLYNDVQALDLLELAQDVLEG